MSKVVERLVCRQLVAYLEQHGLLPSLQSAYRKHHLTITAELKVVSDVLLEADLGDVTLLGLLDLSAAFDTADHEILINHLQTSFGIRGKVLSWILSFISRVVSAECSQCDSCCFCWMQPMWLKSLAVMESPCTCMPTTRSFPSTHQLRHVLHRFHV